MPWPPTTKLGLRDLILAICPPWLTRGTTPTDTSPGKWGRVMYEFGLLGDGLLEKLDQGMKAHMPGYGTAQALPYLGADRVLVQAPAESNAAFILRLKSFLQTWQTAGSAASVLRQILTYFTPYTPLVRLVTNSGVWDWYDAGASIADMPIHAFIGTDSWAWGADWTTWAGHDPWWRFWCLIFPGLSIAGTAVTAASNASPIQITTLSAHGLLTGNQVAIDNVHGNLAANGYWTITKVDGTNFTLDGSSGSGAFATPNGVAYSIPSTALKTPSGQVVGPAPFVIGQPGVAIGEEPTVSIGLNAPPLFFQPLRQLAGTWKSAHSWLRWFVFSFDTAWGSPWNAPFTQPSGGIAPGQWGTWAANNGGGLSVASRNSNCRYVDGVS